MTIADIGYGKQFEGWYDRIFQNDPTVRITADALAALHPDPEGGTLEFGVGTGRIALPLSAAVGTVVGIDSSPEMLATLERKAGEGDVKAELGDIRHYRDDQRYSLVYCVCSTLAQILDPEDQREVVARAAELLRPGGRLVVETHNRGGVEAIHEGQTRTTLVVPYPEPNTALQLNGTLIMDNRIWHCTTMWFESDGTHRIGTETVRLLVPDELDAYARDAGLTPEGHYAGWDRSPYGPSAPLFVATYTKSA